LTRYTTNKEEATSFKEITKLVNTILYDTSIQKETKIQVLKHFSIITGKFHEKKLKGWARIFFQTTKKKQVQSAVDTLRDSSRILKNVEELQSALTEDARRVGTDKEFSQEKTLFNTFIDDRRSGKAVKKELEDWLDLSFCELSNHESFVDLMVQLNSALKSEDSRAQIDKLNAVYLEACALYRSLHENKPLGGEEKSQIMILIISKSIISPSFIEDSVDALKPSDLESEIRITLSILTSMMIYIAKKTADVQSIHEEH